MPARLRPLCSLVAAEPHTLGLLSLYEVPRVPQCPRMSLAAELAALIEVASGGCRLGVVVDVSRTQAGFYWTAPTGLEVLELTSEQILDPTKLSGALAEWPAYEDLECIAILPPMNGFESRWHVSEMAVRSLCSIVSSDLPVICVTTSQPVGAHSEWGLRPGSPFAEVLGFGAPTEAITSEPGRRFRRPAVVLQLPFGLLSGDVDRRSYLVLMKLDPADQVGRTVFAISPTLDLTVVTSELAQLLAGARRTENGFALDPPISLERGLLPSVLDPRRSDRSAEASEIGQLARFGDLFDIRPPWSWGTPTIEEPTSESIPALGPRSLVNGSIDPALVDAWVGPGEREMLRDGDLLLSGVTQFVSGRAARYRSTDGPMVGGPFVLVARPKVSLDDRTIRLLMRFIGSSRFIIQLDAVQAGEFEMNVVEILESVVPMPDQPFLEAFEALEAAEVQFRTWLDEAGALMESSMDSPDLGAARVELLRGGSLIRQRAEAASMLDDLGHRVATRYPLPVAHRWRSALAAKGGPDDLRSVLRANEVLHAYLGILAITSAHLADIELGVLADIRKRLSSRRSGLGLGDWRALLEQFSELKSVRRLPDTHPLIEIRGFRADSTVVQASDELWQLRNDVSHLREFAPGELERTTTAAWSSLENLYEAVSFLTDYPLIRVISTRWDSYSKQNEIQYRQLSGDTPIVPVQTMIVADNTVETESLYLLDAHRRLHLLRPLLVGSECPACGHWSTFHPDRITQEGSVEYKSFEHGHPSSPTDVHLGLSAVGLIDSA